MVKAPKDAEIWARSPPTQKLRNSNKYLNSHRVTRMKEFPKCWSYQHGEQSIPVQRKPFFTTKSFHTAAHFSSVREKTYEHSGNVRWGAPL